MSVPLPDGAMWMDGRLGFRPDDTILSIKTIPVVVQRSSPYNPEDDLEHSSRIAIPDGGVVFTLPLSSKVGSEARTLRHGLH